MSKHISNASTVEAKWIKSSYSGGDSNCVELAELTDSYAVRDSKNPTGPALRFAPGGLRSFVQGVKAGEFDLL